MSGREKSRCAPIRGGWTLAHVFWGRVARWRCEIGTGAVTTLVGFPCLCDDGRDTLVGNNRLLTILTRELDECVVVGGCGCVGRWSFGVTDGEPVQRSGKEMSMRHGCSATGVDSRRGGDERTSVCP